MESKLKPCPFCNSIPAAVFHWSNGDDDGFGIGCDDDNCQVKVALSAPTKEEVIKLWNTRSPIEITEEMVERAVNAILPEPEVITIFCQRTNPFNSCHTADADKYAAERMGAYFYMHRKFIAKAALEAALKGV